jgi:predicted Zn-dependent protease
MKMYFFFALLLYITGCRQNENMVAHFEDYEPFLHIKKDGPNNVVMEEVRFWNERLKINQRDETSLLKLAAIHAELFKTTGLINHISLSDSLYLAALKGYPEGNVTIYHGLCSNAISQHRFQAALLYAENALALKDQKALSLMLLVDASLEVGDYARANKILRQFKNKNSFAYLIRKAKLKDHEGFLDSAIVCMEKAYKRISGRKTLAQWTLTNLADMYGHAGRIKESYDMYLEVLKNNPEDDYALKGIAWIALSHDSNSADSKIIINSLAKRKWMPDAHLMLAEIAALEGNEIERLTQLKRFKSLVDQPAYQLLYHKYLAALEAEDFDNPNAAIGIANNEIINRPTPQSYDLLAWSYYCNGNFKQALEIAHKYVVNQTHEPDALYHIGMIYKATGDISKAEHYLTEALESEFELGPSVSGKIKTTLDAL